MVEINFLDILLMIIIWGFAVYGMLSLIHKIASNVSLKAKIAKLENDIEKAIKTKKELKKEDVAKI